MTDALLQSIHPVLHTDPGAVLLVDCACTVDTTIRITDHQITLVTRGAAARVWPIRDTTIAAWIAQLPGGMTATLREATWADVGVHALLPGTYQIGAGTTHTIPVYTAVNWRIVRPLAVGIAEYRHALAQMVANLDVRQAAGSWLDSWGDLWATPRLIGESDTDFRTRIVASITLPRSNGRAIERVIATALGRTATVRDGGLTDMFAANDPATLVGPRSPSVWGPQSYGAFVVTIDDSDGYTVAQLLEIVRQYKAAGVTFELNVRFAPEAALPRSAFVATMESL